MTISIQLRQINTISRASLAFVFLYHGIVPKMIWLDSTEIYLVELHNLSIKTEVISLLGGMAEIILSLLIIFYRKSLIPIYLASVMFAVLLIDVAIIQPSLLIKAFNPLTMNLMGIALAIIVIYSQNQRE